MELVNVYGVVPGPDEEDIHYAMEPRSQGIC